MPEARKGDPNYANASRGSITINGSHAANGARTGRQTDIWGRSEIWLVRTENHQTEFALNIRKPATLREWESAADGTQDTHVHELCSQMGNGNDWKSALSTSQNYHHTGRFLPV